MQIFKMAINILLEQSEIWILEANNIFISQDIKLQGTKCQIAKFQEILTELKVEIIWLHKAEVEDKLKVEQEATKKFRWKQAL